MGGPKLNHKNPPDMIDYRREVDGLRALAVLPVIFFHAGFEAFSGGFVGVDVFFVISGYLITSLIIAERQAGSFSLARFYERRARRILPALFFVMLVCLPFAWMYLSPADLKRFSQSLVAVAVFGSNILFWLTSSYFEPVAELKPLLHTWSLAVEEQYYVIFPVLLMAAWSLGKRWMVAGLVTIAVLSLGAAQWGSIAKPDATFYLLATRAWELLLGALVAFHLCDRTRRLPSKVVAEIGSAAGLALLVTSVFLFDQDTPFPSLYALVPTVGTALIILFASSETYVGRMLGVKPVVAVGLISYSAYLWHQPMFAFARHRNLEHPSAMMFAGLVVVVLLLAYFSWRYVEAPFRNSRRISRRQIVLFSAAGTAFFISLGLAGHVTKGFLNRYDADERYLATMDTHEAREGLEALTASLQMKPFDPSDRRPRVLIIGDSFGKDLINALEAGGLMDSIQTSFRPISSTCGNLFVSPDKFQQAISEHRWPVCKKEWIYDDRELRDLMLAADEIWFASSWRGWQSHYIEESVANAERFAQKPVKVFGTKNFGKIRVKYFLDMPEATRVNFKGSVGAEALEINGRIKQALRHDVFVDTQGLICGSNPAVCNLFTPEGELITYDGGHLTRRGAEFFGQRIARCVPSRLLIKQQGATSASCYPSPAT